MIITIVSGDMGPAAMAAFWIVVGVVGLACLLGALVLIFPGFGSWLKSVKW